MNVHSTPSGKLPSTILVGVEEAGLSDHAVRAALDLGTRLNAEVHLVHAVRVPLFEWMGSDPARGPIATEEMLKAVHQRVNDRVQSLAGPQADKKGVRDLRVLPGAPAAVLLEAAREEKADWIVLGDHRKRGLIDFGSTARTVLAKGTVPVWIQARPVRRIQSILVPIDMSQDSMRALSSARTLAKALGAALRAVYFFDAASLYAASTPDPLGFTPAISVPEIRDSERSVFEKAASHFDWQGVEHSADFLQSEPIEGVLELSQSADLIVMGTHGRTGLASAVLGSVAHSVIKRSDRPVLAIPHPGRKFLL